MPIYVYRCDSCGENHEVLQKVNDAPLRTCPHCGAENVRKVIAPVGVIFKGSGFHKNDYTATSGGAKKSDSSGSTSSSTPESGAGGEKKSESSGDSKKSESSSSSSPDSGGGGGKDSSSSGKVA